jgi:deoxyribodipyrimidine photolyase
MDGASRLSAYLHFGQISPVYVAPHDELESLPYQPEAPARVMSWCTRHT